MPPPAPQRERKLTERGLAPAQAPQGEAFAEDEPETAPAIPHPFSEPPAPPLEPARARPRAREDSRDISIDGLEARLAEHVGSEKELKRRLADSEAARLELQRTRLPSEPPKRSGLLKALGFLGLPVLVVSLAGYIDARTAALKRQVEAADQEHAKAKDTNAEHQAATDKWERAVVLHVECVERQFRAFGVRAAGHDFTSLPRGGTEFAEQNRPPAHQVVPWDRATWFTIEQCPALPAAPAAPP